MKRNKRNDKDGNQKSRSDSKKRKNSPDQWESVFGESSRSSTVNHTSSTRHEDPSSDAPEIPGFYYDKERKKYFRILPNHSTVSSAVTKETVMKKEQDNKWKRDVKQSDKRGSICATTVKEGLTYFGNLPHLLLHTQQGSLQQKYKSSIDTMFLFKRISNLKPKNKCPVPLIEARVPGDLQDIKSMEVGTDQDCVLCMGDMKQIKSEKIQLFYVKQKPRLSEDIYQNLKIESNDACDTRPLGAKITSFCLASRGFSATSDPNEKHVIYTTLYQTSSWESRSYALFLLLPTNSVGNGSGRRIMRRFDLGPSYVWTCAWNNNAMNFSVGIENRALLVNAETKRISEFYTNQSDPFTQVFSLYSNSCLYSGTRRGQILSHDLRSVSTRPVLTVNHSSSVCSLHLYSDESKLLASDVYGKVCLWDLRMQRVVVNYKGMVNEGKQIPIHIDSTERLVYGVGQDSYTRFWNLRTGDLLTTLPPPNTPDTDSLPSVAYSECWDKQKGNAALLLAQKQHIYLYPSFQMSMNVG